MIDPKLQAELRAKYNPDGSELRKMQLRMLEMLKYIDKICRDNNIKYWLSSGTCLGAVRHGGFIPWDDDVDIELLEKDAKLLMKILKSSKSSYILQNIQSDRDYLHSFPKLRDLNSRIKEYSNTDKWNKYKGIYIDIFILEPSNSVKFFTFCTKVWMRTVYKCPQIENSIIRHLCNISLQFLLKKIFPPFIKPFYKINSNGNLRHLLGGMFPKKRYIGDIEETIHVPFENTLLPIPKNYDNYLRSIYGEYMQLPDLKKIQVHSKNIEIW